MASVVFAINNSMASSLRSTRTAYVAALPEVELRQPKGRVRQILRATDRAAQAAPSCSSPEAPSAAGQAASASRSSPRRAAAPTSLQAFFTADLGPRLARRPDEGRELTR